MATPAPAKIAPTCPPLIAELIKMHPTKRAAMDAAGIAEGHFYSIIRGSAALTDDVKANVEAALRGEKPTPIRLRVGGARDKKGSANGHDAAAPPVVAAAALPQAPPFQPWNGKMLSVEVEGKAGHKKEKFKKCPAPLAKLLNLAGGSRLAAARAVGLATGTAITNILKGEREFDVKMQQLVHRALNGLPLKDNEDEADDAFKLGIAIVLTTMTSYERVEELAEIMDGTCLVRRAAGSAGLLVIWRFPQPDMTRKFKRLASRDAKDIFCP